MASRWRRRYGLLASASIIGLLVAGAAAVWLWAPYDPTAVAIQERLRPPTSLHPLGTDHFGRDVLARLATGTSIALTVATIATAISLVAGVIVGAVAGFAGGWLDEVAMRTMDALLAFPALLLAIAVVAALGPSHHHAAIAIGVVGIPVFARLTRSVVVGLVVRDFVTAARAQGAAPLYVLARHVMPNTLAPIIVQASLAVGRAILAEAGLSYLGLGTQPPIASWGKMLHEAQGFMSQAPWLAIFPGCAIAVTVLAFNVLGDALRDLLDPRLRH